MVPAMQHGCHSKPLYSTDAQPTVGQYISHASAKSSLILGQHINRVSVDVSVVNSFGQHYVPKVNMICLPCFIILVVFNILNSDSWRFLEHWCRTANHTCNFITSNAYTFKDGDSTTWPNNWTVHSVSLIFLIGEISTPRWLFQKYTVL